MAIACLASVKPELHKPVDYYLTLLLKFQALMAQIGYSPILPIYSELPQELVCC